ncbi:hypothetical protein HanIR_Chr06g0289641 [Helianthus annuus]|nr:hypothetical protein HanIR_Chr06g0289641 [Helianthus annuus]
MTAMVCRPWRTRGSDVEQHEKGYGQCHTYVAEGVDADSFKELGIPLV